MLVPIGLADLLRHRFVQWLELDRQRLLLGITLAMLVASVTLTVKYGGLVPNHAFRAGHISRRVIVSSEARKTYRWVEETAAMIPRDASVGASGYLGNPFPEEWAQDVCFFFRFDFLLLPED